MRWGTAMETDRPFRPYAPPGTSVAVLQRLRRMNTPARLSREFLRGAGVSENLIPRILATLRFLSLVVGEDEPTDTLRALASSPDDEYRKLLEQVVRTAYREDFENINPAEDPQSTIISAFQRYQPSSQHDRQVMLFLGLCREAGIAVLDAPRERPLAAKRTQTKKAVRPKAITATPEPLVVKTNIPTPGISVGSPSTDGLPLGITFEDMEAWGDDFDQVWAALGTVARAQAKARAKQRAAASVPATVGREEEAVDDEDL
jgi:hypothetical protein